MLLPVLLVLLHLPRAVLPDLLPLLVLASVMLLLLLLLLQALLNLPLPLLHARAVLQPLMLQPDLAGCPALRLLRLLGRRLC